MGELNTFPGVDRAVKSLMGGSYMEQRAYEDKYDRLTRQRRSQALMDSAIAEAVKDREIANSYSNLRKNEPAGRDTDIMLAGLGSSFSARNQGLLYEKKLELQNKLVEMVEAGDLDSTEFNQLISAMMGQSITASEIRPEDQAAAEIASEQALGGLRRAKTTTEEDYTRPAIEALTGQRQSATAYNEARTGAKGAGGIDEEDYLPNSAILYDLFPADVDGNRKELDDFTSWRVKAVQINPKYNRFSLAYNDWKAGNPPQPPASDSDPVAEDAAAAVVGQPETDSDVEPAAKDPIVAAAQEGVQERPANYGNIADAEALVQGAARAISNKKDPKLVVQRMAAELKRLGISDEQIQAISDELLRR